MTPSEDATMTAPDLSDSYALGRSGAETQRLILQHQIYGRFTRQFLVEAGITNGMRVLDVGSGAGDVALVLAELVGPQGRVVGTDTNEEILQTAARRASALGCTNVNFHHGTAHDIDGEGFDAVVGRWVLMYLADPAAELRLLADRLRPGGVIAFQEGVFDDPKRPYPPGPLHDQVLAWMTPPPGAPGPDTQMGLKLFRTFLAAGLEAPKLRLDTPIGAGADWPGYDYLAATLRSLLPFLEGVGAVTSEEVDIDTLAHRLRDEVVEHGRIQMLPPLIGAWTRT
jgi:SAM-dependent methyltransferase